MNAHWLNYGGPKVELFAEWQIRRLAPREHVKVFRCRSRINDSANFAQRRRRLASVRAPECDLDYVTPHEQTRIIKCAHSQLAAARTSGIYFVFFAPRYLMPASQKDGCVIHLPNEPAQNLEIGMGFLDDCLFFCCVLILCESWKMESTDTNLKSSKPSKTLYKY
jgi:hypothetical protein